MPPTFGRMPGGFDAAWLMIYWLGARAGLFPLSTTTVTVSTLYLNYGHTSGTGPATHHLTLYRAPSGALVFGAGTVQWSWGLDANHFDSGAPTDPNMQQATVILLQIWEFNQRRCKVAWFPLSLPRILQRPGQRLPRLLPVAA